jgi:hypothetical protein
MYAYGSYQDIHQRKRSQLELWLLQKHRKATLDLKSYTPSWSPIALFIQYKWRCIYANETWLKMAEAGGALLGKDGLTSFILRTWAMCGGTNPLSNGEMEL